MSNADTTTTATATAATSTGIPAPRAAELNRRVTDDVPCPNPRGFGVDAYDPLWFVDRS